jgi:GntR family transcriptional regulator
MTSVGVLPHHGQSSVTAQTATAADRRHLNVGPRTALLIERRLIADQHSVPVEWTESRYVPERYVLTNEFTVELPARGSRGGPR